MDRLEANSKELVVFTLPTFAGDGEISVVLRRVPPLWSALMEMARDFRKQWVCDDHDKMDGADDASTATSHTAATSTVCSYSGESPSSSEIDASEDGLVSTDVNLNAAAIGLRTAFRTGIDRLGSLLEDYTPSSDEGGPLSMRVRSCFRESSEDKRRRERQAQAAASAAGIFGTGSLATTTPKLEKQVFDLPVQLLLLELWKNYFDAMIVEIRHRPLCLEN